MSILKEPAIASEIVRQRDVPQAMDLLSGAIEHLQAELTELEKRLSPLLRNEINKTSEGKPEKTMVEHAETIRNHSGSIEDSAQFINEMIRRLEL